MISDGRDPRDTVVDPFDPGAPDVPDEVLREVPKGAAALALAAVGSLMAAWIAIYVFVFLPRGMVG